MMKRIMSSGVAAAALAASALLAAPSAGASQPPKQAAHATIDVNLGVRPFRSSPLPALKAVKARHRYARDRGYGYSGRRDRALRRDAVRQCRRAVRDEGYAMGFREIEFEDRHVRQIGPAGFAVRLETEFEGRRREFERDVYCEVRRGRVVRLDGVPRPRRARYRR